MMPAFSSAISASVSPSRSVWSREMGVTTETTASATLVASVTPPRPTSRTTTSTGSSANTAKPSVVTASKYVSGTSPAASSSASTVCTIGRISPHTRTKVSSATGAPSMLIRSVTRCRCGEV